MSLLERLRGSAFWPMLWKEFIQMRRDRFTLGMMIGIPAIQLALFGYAIQTEVRHLPTVVLDESRTRGEPALVRPCSEHRELRPRRRRARDRKALDECIERDARRPAWSSRRFRRPRSAARTARADHRRRGRSAVVSLRDLRRRCWPAPHARGHRWPASRGRGPPLEVRVRPWYNPGTPERGVHRAGHHRRAALDDADPHHEHGDRARAGARARSSSSSSRRSARRA